ncbi:Eco57I restriction-modification methylase domain-containing protein [Janibacter indicus]|uniref:Eco57I restriction-modification methylase domain-containing protein n=1 Tax=Janibacter indicus TaxID=857417 RepID=A0A7L9J619_9MICO|nr:Eco57I restriction-modification methylase domain-containing protein [Janibacter indicus]QOK24190.1 Eco57I restriction-modification methylase domain-containing protein [Janibacter indicus]
MSKKFDVVIGNPPYQEEATGDGTRDTPVYHLFMAAAYEVASKAVLITPARFLFNAGFTPKKWNTEMLNDPRLTVPFYVPNSAQLFPGTDIKGGIAVTSWDESREGDPITTFTSYPELNAILHKVGAAGDDSMESLITTSRSFRYTTKLYEDHPELLALRPKGNEGLVESNAFDQFSTVFHEARPQDGQDYVRVLGLQGRGRVYRWIRTDYFDGPDNLWKFKVALPKANGSGQLGEVFASPLVIEPGVGTTHTFITIGALEDEVAANACLNYVKTKFARTMLGVAKITQDNKRHTWRFVPRQDFSTSSDIDWSKSIPEIDQQLYKKYGLDDEEIAFIEEKVKPMA